MIFAFFTKEFALLKMARFLPDALYKVVVEGSFFKINNLSV